MSIDHVVLWVDNQQHSLAFFVDLLGMEPVRSDEFAEGKTSFPSVRLNEATLIDLMDRSAAPKVREFTGGEAGGAPINHVCLSMAASEYAAIASRLAERGVELKSSGTGAFGARGAAEQSAYFSDPDGNVVEIRHYGEQAALLRSNLT